MRAMSHRTSETDLRAAPPRSRPDQAVTRMTVCLDSEIAEQIERLAFRLRSSKSIIAERALESFFNGKPDAAIANRLKSLGVWKRRG